MHKCIQAANAFPWIGEQCVKREGACFSITSPSDSKFPYSLILQLNPHRRSKAKQAAGKEEEVADTGRPNSESVINSCLDHFRVIFDDFLMQTQSGQTKSQSCISVLVKLLMML